MQTRPLAARFAAAFAAAAAIAVALPVRAQDPVTGSTNGEVEQPIIDRIVNDCIRHETDAAAVIADLGRNARPNAQQAEDVKAALELARISLESTASAINSGKTHPKAQAGTKFDAAQDSLAGARGLDHDAVNAVDHGGRVKDIRKFLKRALAEKTQAILDLEGIAATPAETRTGCYDPKLITPDAPVGALAVRFEGTHDAQPEHFGGHGEFKDVRFFRPFTPFTLIHPPFKRAAKAPKNHYLAARTTSKSATGAYGFVSLGRDLSGPYEARITVGSLTKNKAARAARGTAFGCIEFDVKGSSPLTFLSVCARPMSNGVQAFATSSNGQQGSTFLAGVDAVVLKTTYDGTTFTCFVKAATAADSTFVQFATWTRAQGADLWVAGFGAAQLSGAAEIGLDDVAIYAITR